VRLNGSPDDLLQRADTLTEAMAVLEKGLAQRFQEQGSDTSPLSGTFAGLAEGAVFAQDSNLFQITYQGGPNGNSVVLTCVA
jgi:hypothetical protein